MIKIYFFIKKHSFAKIHLILLGLLFISITGYSQNVGINSDGSAPNASAGLDVSFTNKGLLIPRVALTSTTDVTTISSPATSLLIYNTSTASDVTPGYYYYDGAAWQKLSISTTTSQWNISGSNVYYTSGNVGIGVSNPNYKLHIDGADNPLFLRRVLLGTSSDSILTIANGIVRKLPFGSVSQWTTSGSNLTYSGGNIGIGTLSALNPTYKLQIDGSSTPLFVGGVPNGSTTDSLLTITSGVVRKLPQNGLLTTGWSLTGNNASSATQFIGTTNNDHLKFRTNNQQRVIIDSLGSVGIGSNPTFSTDREKVLIDLGGSQASPLASNSYNALNVKGYLNNYLQINVQNKYSGTDASSDLIASADNATESNFYVDLGINNTGNTKNYFGGPNDAYLYNLGQDFLIGNGTSNKSLLFLTGGGSKTSNERMRITSSGNVGIGTKDPKSKLHISATNPLSLSGLQSGAADTVLTLVKGVVKYALKSTVNNQSWSVAGNNNEADSKIGTNDPYALSIVTDNTERIRVSSNGTVGVGTFFDNDGNTITALDENYKLVVDGDALATTWATTSDRRLKTNIKDLNYGLKSLMQLQPVSYNWIDPKQSTQTQIGLIAQDAKKVIPEIVLGDEDKGKLSINYTELIPVLINAIKEQQSTIEAQQKQIDELKQLILKK